MASNYKDINYGKKFRYSEKETVYTFQLKKRRNWWWLLLLLLPLLLLIRCERDITVKCIDESTGEPIPGVATTLSYTAHYLYNDGQLFDAQPYHGEITTDAEGEARYERLGCSVWSYIFFCLSQATATGELYPYTTAQEDALFHFTDEIVLKMSCDSTARDVDLVMCVDNTGSMGDVIDMVKRNARKFHSDLLSVAKAKSKPIRKTRVRVIVYGDFIDSELTVSRMFDLPAETDAYENFVNKIEIDGGEDEPEDGLEAISTAFNSDWTTLGSSRRHVVVVYTDASTHDLGERKGLPSYPAGVATDMAALRKQWEGMDPTARRLVLFAPDEPSWGEISRTWPDVELHPGDLSDELTGSGYRKVLEDIVNSL